MLMQTPITIECGPNLETKLTYHKEMICCHSKQLEAMFVKAKPMTVYYEKADKLRNDLAKHVFPEVNPKEFEDKKMDRQVCLVSMPWMWTTEHQWLIPPVSSMHEVRFGCSTANTSQAIPLIKTASENYPLIGYASLVKKTIMDAVAGEMIAKNNRKTAQNPAADLSLAGRLEILKPRAVHEVVAKLFTVVHRINRSEIRKAEEDIYKATAQHRIILPGVDESTVRALMQWIYQKTLPFEGSEQTYAVMNLAERLGVDVLATKCRDALCHVTNASIERADADGTSFQTLIGYGTKPAADDIVRVVFEHAMTDETAPRELRSLIIDALAGYLDLGLWQHVKGQIKHLTALQLIESMVRLRPLVKTEMDGQDSIKSESQEVSSTDVSGNMEVDEDKKPIHVKEQNENHV